MDAGVRVDAVPVWPGCAVCYAHVTVGGGAWGPGGQPGSWVVAQGGVAQGVVAQGVVAQGVVAQGVVAQGVVAVTVWPCCAVLCCVHRPLIRSLQGV